MRYLYNQQNKFGNCFILPNSIMQLDLSPLARLIYFYLVYIEDRKTYQCYPSYKTIGKALNIASKTMEDCKNFCGLLLSSVVCFVSLEVK